MPLTSRTLRTATVLMTVLALAGALALSLRPDDDAAPLEVFPGASARQRLLDRAALEPCPPVVGVGLDVVLPCLGAGPSVRLDGTPSGVPTLVNVYGSWCGPCREEMPLLAAFRERAAGRVALLGVDAQDDPDGALRLAVASGQHWPAVVDEDGDVLRRYGSGAPVTLLVDGAGEVAFVQRGAFRSAAQLEALVARHLGVAL
ncbi:MAG: TlpA family protein disulfide reductase [Frankiales bacterium]|nr:TlpA family protein disulfide reductase [Frankiales bacterium]